MSSKEGIKCTRVGGRGGVCLRIALVAAALQGLASAAAAPASTAAGPAPVAATTQTACQQLNNAYATTKAGVAVPPRAVSVHGRARSVLVLWDGRAPSRAAAALLAAALRHALRYRRVRLARGPGTYCMLAQRYNNTNLEYSDSAYDNVAVAPSIAWTNKRCLSLEFSSGNVSSGRWTAPPRLQATGAAAGGAGAAALRLHAALAAAAPDACRNAGAWTFYTDLKNLQLCGFTPLDKPESSATVYTIADDSKVIDELKQRIDGFYLHMKVVPLQMDAESRTSLIRLLEERKSSFLFLDYDIWMDKGVIRVAPPPPVHAAGPAALDDTRAVRVADELVLREIAPAVLQALNRFSPSPTHLRQILELEAQFGIEEGACLWALNNTPTLDSIMTKNYQEHWITVFICDDEPNKEDYKKVVNLMENAHRIESELAIKLYTKEINCTSEDELNNEYLKLLRRLNWQKLVGVIATGAGIKTAAENAPGTETALVFYSAPAPRVPLGPHARAVGGSVKHLAMAIHHFLTKFKWKRLALLTENTEFAKGLFEALDSNKKIALRNADLFDVTPTNISKTLKSFQNADAKIFFVNTNAEIANMVLCEALGLGMIETREYVWILRERQSSELKCDNKSVQVNHFTISFWWRGGANANLSLDGEATRMKLSELWGNASWPQLAAPLADALEFLMKTFKVFTTNHPDKFYDLHGHGTTELLLDSLEKQQVDGLIQRLEYKNGIITEPYVFVDRWKNDHHELLFQWRVHEKGVKVATEMQKNIYDGKLPTDGSSFCITTANGDRFLPHCNDFVWFTTIVVIAITCAALFIARRIRMQRLARHDSLLKAQLLAQREYVARALEDHYVDRAALELHHDLGHGCFGRVRYGILRAPERPAVSVAVKEIRDDVSPIEESELLREACTIASLRHDHVVRLIGVCSTGGPLLVLMEYAFFGNLREYLWERRHLVVRLDEADVDEIDEAYHVSAISLTRLAKEVASALDYLAQERLVHRDVRASNCLVDAHRSLKLADFGLARKTGTGLGGEAEYSCRRRGLFPVLWMAPESLERGVFTAASDAWALGVLLLELATLGARPYGAWPPMRVLHYVSAGGRPPMPADASSDTRRILAACWRSAPEERLTASALLALLEASPRALRPALQPVTPPADEDCPAIDDATEPLV